MSDKIEFEARLTFEAHRGCGSVISTWDHAPGQPNVLSRLPGGRYHVTLEPIEPELRPCPFCNRTDKLTVSNDADLHDHVPSWYVCCDWCSCRGPEHPSKEVAIATWNRREK